MNLQSKFGYFIISQTLINALCLKAGRNYGQTDRQTDKWTDKQTDDPITRCPRRTFQAGGIKIILTAILLQISKIYLRLFLSYMH